MCWSEACSGNDSMPNHGCVGSAGAVGVDARLLRQAAAVEVVEVAHRVAVLAAQQPARDRVEDAHQQRRSRPAVGHHEDVLEVAAPCSPRPVQRSTLVEPGRGLHADQRPLVELGQVRARPRRCTTTARPSRSGRSGPRRPAAGGRGTSARTRCPPRRGPCAPGRTTTPPRCGWPRRGPRPSRRTP